MNKLFEGDNLTIIVILMVMTFAMLGCGETEYERNYHTHWHKHNINDWAYHADDHSHSIEEADLKAHKLRYGGIEEKLIVRGHVWFYHGYKEEKLLYEKYLIWAEKNLEEI